MKAEKPAEGILKRNDWGDSKSYVVGCQCCGSECEHNVWVEADDSEVTITTYTKQRTKFWSFNRFQLIWTLLTTGYVEYEASIIMSKQQALNYSETLKSAVKDVEEFCKQRTRKNDVQNKIASRLAEETDCI